MKKIDINKQQNVKLVLFNDNQPHVTLEGINFEDTVDVTVSLKDSITVLNLLEVSNALDKLFCKKRELHIPYLMAARSDRVMVKGDSVDIEVIANLINSLGFEKVYLYDVHSEISSILIKNSISISNKRLVMEYCLPNAVLLIPDAGAVKKSEKYLEWATNIVDTVQCTKVRDLNNKGKITLKVLEPEKCTGRNCVIIDDLCDGGGTFLGIASQLFNVETLTLVVTHGIFSKGFTELERYFNQILTTNSYKTSHSSPIVKVIDSKRLKNYV